MAVPIYCELVCDQCSRTREGRYTFGRIPRRAMIFDAKGAGWVFKDDKVFCSVNCRAIYDNRDVSLRLTGPSV